MPPPPVAVGRQLQPERERREGVQDTQPAVTLVAGLEVDAVDHGSLRGQLAQAETARRPRIEDEGDEADQRTHQHHHRHSPRVEIGLAEHRSPFAVPLPRHDVPQREQRETDEHDQRRPREVTRSVAEQEELVDRANALDVQRDEEAPEPEADVARHQDQGPRRHQVEPADQHHGQGDDETGRRTRHEPEATLVQEIPHDSEHEGACPARDHQQAHGVRRAEDRLVWLGPPAATRISRRPPVPPRPGVEDRTGHAPILDVAAGES